MTRVGLVLGAGGLVGQAYHSGVLAALENDLHWDARTADRLVGTSAGSLTASLLRMGVSALDLACWSRGSHWDETAEILDQLDRFRARLPNIRVRNLLHPWHLPGSRMLLGALQERGSLRFLPMAASMLPSGQTSLLDLMEDDLIGWSNQTWPENLWLCAVRRADGRRVVFGREGSPRVSLPQAVAASSAIPGHFSAVIVDGTEYTDGGLYSPTNADLLAEEDVDLVVIVSPMSGGSGATDAALRSAARRHLRAEVKTLERAGKNVVCFEPSHQITQMMGLNPMARGHIDRVVAAAFFEAGAAAATPRMLRLLSLLRGRQNAASDAA